MNVLCCLTSSSDEILCRQLWKLGSFLLYLCWTEVMCPDELSTVVLDAPVSLSCTVLLIVVVFSLVPDWGLSSGSIVGCLKISEKLVFQALNCSLIQGCDISWSVVSCKVSTGRPNGDLPPRALFLGFAIWSLFHEELTRKPLHFDIEVEWRWFCFPEVTRFPASHRCFCTGRVFL